MEIPKFLNHLATYSGLPVPFTVFIDDKGVPDFKTIDRAKTLACVQRRLCFICGHKMGGSFWFIGGPTSMASNMFTDGPMHKVCATFSSKTCPFLTGRVTSHSKCPKVIEGANVVVNPHVATERPSQMYMRKAMVYEIAAIGESLIFVVTKWFGKPIPF